MRALRQAALESVAARYRNLGTTLIDDVPLVVPITGACENTATLYAISRSSGLYLSQTAQLTLEVELKNYDAVYCCARSFRAEPPDDRHLPEFLLIEEEFAGAIDRTNQREHDTLFEFLLERITGTVRTMLEGIINVGIISADERARVERVISLAVQPPSWPRVTYREALELLNKSGRCLELRFGDDLTSKHELAIVELVCARESLPPVPVFVTHFPEQIKFFNMKSNPEDEEVVLSADLLLPTSGEAVGAAIREDDYSKLVRRLESSEMLRQLEVSGRHGLRDFGGYLALIASGGVPLHAGYGIGVERLLQFVLAEPDIRQVSGIHQLLRALEPEPDNDWWPTDDTET